MENAKVCMRCGNTRIVSYAEPRKRVECNDGTTLSVQVGENLYCTPRNDDGPWTHVEVGYPSALPPDSWKEFGDTYDDSPADVYAFVPVALVEEYIAAHGGRKVWV